MNTSLPTIVAKGDPENRNRTFSGKEMTKRDGAKLRKAYSCNEDGSRSGCGGHFQGEYGEIDLEWDDFKGHDGECEWLFYVRDGLVVRLKIEEFQVIFLKRINSGLHTQMRISESFEAFVHAISRESENVSKK